MLRSPTLKPGSKLPSPPKKWSLWTDIEQSKKMDLKILFIITSERTKCKLEMWLGGVVDSLPSK